MVPPGFDEAIRFQRDLYLYWREAVAMGSLPLTSRRYVVRPALRRIRERLAAPAGGSTDAAADLSEGEDLRLLFVRRLLERLSLLRTSPDDPRLLPAPQGEMARYLSHPLGYRLRICARLWVAGGWWPDRPDPRAEPPRIMTPAPPRLALARRRLMDALVAQAPGGIIALPSGDLARQTRIMRASGSGRLRGHERQRTLTAPGEEEIARAALQGPLAWLGLVAAEEGGIFRASQALPALREEAELTEPASRVIAQPNLELIAYPPLAATVLNTLDAWAEEVTLGVAAQYRLSRAAFARASRAGWSAERVGSALEVLTGVPLPANVRVTLGDWERHAERVCLTPDVLVFKLPASLLDALLADRAAATWVERRLSPTVALLAPGSVEHVRTWLLRKGELPALR
jgi:hypothetical protein